MGDLISFAFRAIMIARLAGKGCCRCSWGVLGATLSFMIIGFICFCVRGIQLNIAYHASYGAALELDVGQIASQINRDPQYMRWRGETEEQREAYDNGTYKNARLDEANAFLKHVSSTIGGSVTVEQMESLGLCRTEKSWFEYTIIFWLGTFTLLSALYANIYNIIVDTRLWGWDKYWRRHCKVNGCHCGSCVAIIIELAVLAIICSAYFLNFLVGWAGATNIVASLTRDAALSNTVSAFFVLGISSGVSPLLGRIFLWYKPDGFKYDGAFGDDQIDREDPKKKNADENDFNDKKDDWKEWVTKNSLDYKEWIRNTDNRLLFRKPPNWEEPEKNTYIQDIHTSDIMPWSENVPAVEDNAFVLTCNSGSAPYSIASMFAAFGRRPSQCVCNFKCIPMGHGKWQLRVWTREKKIMPSTKNKPLHFIGKTKKDHFGFSESDIAEANKHDDDKKVYKDKVTGTKLFPETIDSYVYPDRLEETLNTEKNGEESRMMYLYSPEKIDKNITYYTLLVYFHFWCMLMMAFTPFFRLWYLNANFEVPQC